MLRLFNTLSRTVEDFQPIHPPHVGFYGCGPTVYDRAHIGNLRAYVFDDILRRTLQHAGYDVRFVMNITDVGHLTSDADEGEDKLEKGAAREKLSVWDVAQKYTDLFKQDLAALSIAEPDQWLKATEHIPEQIALIKQLEAKGFTYTTSDGVYYDTSKFPNYGQLARLNLEGQKEGARVEANKEKRNPTDFALWKFSPRGSKRQMEWASPWGKGFPGWHVECSAMSMKALGETFDIHTGGVDHIPVHHTNEIAQSEGATGKPIVKYWVHNAFLLVDNGKMAKSLGNAYTLDDVRAKGFSPLAFRYYCLGTHYRSKLNFTWEGLQAAQTALDELTQRVANMEESSGQLPELEAKFTDAVENDLNTPQALAVVWEVVKSSKPDALKKAALLRMDTVLGLDLAAAQREVIDVPTDVHVLLDERMAARRAKDWQRADDLRVKIEAAGFSVQDTPTGQVLGKR